MSICRTLIGLFLLTLAARGTASALDYPTRPVRLIVGYAAGGSADIVARLIAEPLAERLGGAIVVENRPGAGTNIGTEAVAKAPPDGYALLLASAANAINATLYQKLTFDFIRDIAPVAGISREPNVVVVHPSIPVSTIPQFIAYAKANPGKIAMASGGNGAASHVSGEMFKLLTGISMTHVPYRGAGPALTDLLGGQVQVYFSPMAATIEYIRSGKLHALAVTTAARSVALPEVPTVSEFVPDYEASQWYGIGAPRNTPPEIIERLNATTNAIVADERFKARLAVLGQTAIVDSPAGFEKLIAAETAKWAKVVKFSGTKID
jgi:tripartite-type tricarboxylate transporter receptor subunit TctC